MIIIRLTILSEIINHIVFDLDCDINFVSVIEEIKVVLITIIKVDWCFSTFFTARRFFGR